MFDTPQKLKDFIVWCQENKVKTFKYEDLQFELSELAFIPQAEELKEINLSDSSAFSDTGMTEEERKEYEDLLYWSSGKVPAKQG